MARRGRRSKAGVARTPSGRISRAVSAQKEDQQVIATRQRLFGLSAEDAKQPMAGTFAGRLYLTGQLGKKPNCDVMWEALQEYQRRYEAFQRSVKSPDGLRTSNGGGDQGESEAYTAWCINAKAKWKAVEDAVRWEQNLHEHRGRNFYAALDYIVLRDQEMWHMVGDVRLALNAVAHECGLLGKKGQVAA